MDNQRQPIKPIRRRRKWLRWLAVPAGIATLATVYQLTRPPELVWWRSAEVGAGWRVRLLVPSAWEVVESNKHSPDPAAHLVQYHWFLSPADRRPRILRKLFPPERENCFLAIDAEYETGPDALHRDGSPTRRFEDAGLHKAVRAIAVPDRGMYVEGTYMRANLYAFNRTYKQICNSLTIE